MLAPFLTTGGDSLKAHLFAYLLHIVPEARPPSTYFTEAHRVSLGTGTLQGRRAGCQSSRNSLTSRDLPPLLCHQKRPYQGTSTQGGARVWPTDCPTEGLGA